MLASAIVCLYCFEHQNVQRKESLMSKIIPINEIKVWKEIDLGTGLKTMNDFFIAMKETGCIVPHEKTGLFSEENLVVAKEKTRIKLVVLYVAQFGVEHVVPPSTICNKAKGSGLDLCPYEAALQLRIQYADQALNEELLIATEPKVDRDGRPSFFQIDRNSEGLRIFSNAGAFWHSFSKVVFMLPEKKPAE